MLQFSMLYMIFHGAFGSPEGNWFPDLKERLTSLGQKVIIPEFPVDKWESIEKDKPKKYKQTIDNWYSAFEQYLPEIKEAKIFCFVGHSLGPLFILHAVEKYNLKLDSAIFISPFLEKLNTEWQFDVVNSSFYKTDFNFEKLKKLIPTSYVLISDNDPYAPNQRSVEFAGKLGSSTITVRQAAHMNSEVNLNEFPLVLELCKSRIDLTLYQRFLEHRRELFAVPYTTGKTEEMIYLDPDEVQYEGIFHFRNLRKEGFATFFTGTTFWDAQSKYMQEARKAANRVKHFTRVFIVSKPSELERPEMKNQIKLDFEAGIKLYLCKMSDLVGNFLDMDFGVWDDDYVCFVPMDRRGHVSQVKLSSRKKDMEEARKRKEFILKRSVKINDPEKDIPRFIKSFN